MVYKVLQGIKFPTFPSTEPEDNSFKYTYKYPLVLTDKAISDEDAWRAYMEGEVAKELAIEDKRIEEAKKIYDGDYITLDLEGTYVLVPKQILLDNNYYAGLYGEDPTWGAAIGYQESTLGKNRKYETPESFYSAWNYSRSPLLGNTVGGSIDKLRRILATVNNIYSIKSTGIPEEAYGRDLKVQYLNRAYTKIPFYSGERNDDLATSALDAMTKDLDNNTSYGAFGDRNLRGLKHDVDYERSHGSKDWYNYDNVYQFVFDQEKKGLLNPKETDRKAKIAKRILLLKLSKAWNEFMNGEGGEAYQRGVAERNKRGFKRGGILRKYLKAYHE